MDATNPSAQSLAWQEVPADEVGDAIVAAMALGGIDHLFFTSGTEIGFYQEAIAKAKAHNRPAPRLISVLHEHACLNAAMGYAAVSGKPTATAVHVDVGTQHYGGAVHTARHSCLPILITAGAPATAYPGSMRGAREGAHIWLQQGYDQNGIVRQYVKWDHRMALQDNPGLVVSRALQVARSEPCGPVYLSLPREVVLNRMEGCKFPTADQLGIPRPAAPDPDGIQEIAERLIWAKNPFVVADCGRNPAAVTALVDLCELVGMPVIDGGMRAYQNLPLGHPLFQPTTSLKDADVVLVLDANVPWNPGPDAPGSNAYVAVIDADPIRLRIPIFEFTANLRLVAQCSSAIPAIAEAVRSLATTADTQRFQERAAHWAILSRERRNKLEEEARAHETDMPIDPTWLAYQIGAIVDDNCIVCDDTTHNRAAPFLLLSRPGSYFHNPGSSGGWGAGFAFGAKLAAPERDVILVSGDGFYGFGTSKAAMWSATHYGAPFMAVIFQNRSFGTGTVGVANVYPDGYAARSGFDGGFFDPPVDLAKEAEAAGAYGENVRDPEQLAPALRRGLEQIRSGTPALIAVWLPRLIYGD